MSVHSIARPITVAALLAGAAGSGAAQDTTRVRPDSIVVADSVEVSASRRGFGTGTVRRLVLGGHYRELQLEQCLRASMRADSSWAQA